MLQLRKIYLALGISIHGRRRFHQKDTNFAASIWRTATFLQKWQSLFAKKGVNALGRFPIKKSGAARGPRPMPRVYIFQAGGKWMIRTKGCVQGHFAGHADAVAAAVDIALSIGKAGRDQQMLVDGELDFRKLWVWKGPDQS
jgi:hypothetical protein